jgi:hypothetical protein
VPLSGVATAHAATIVGALRALETFSQLVECVSLRALGRPNRRVP